MLSSDMACEVIDVIHGHVRLTKIERSIIDHQYFQRLRRIKQLGLLNLVFPSANHTRFEHSLGAMHLASNFFKALLLNTTQIADKYGGSDGFPEIRKRCKYAKKHLKELELAEEKLIQIIRLCALLHDVGHGPFSHIFKEVMPKWKHIKKHENGTNKRMLGRLMSDKSKEADRLKHEDYSVAIVEVLFAAPTIRHTLQAKNIDHRKLHRLFWYITTGSVKFSDKDLAGLCNVKSLPDGTLKIIKSIVAGIIDVDRMDFLYRDSHHAGVKYGLFDIGRLKESLVIWPESDRKIQLAIRSSGLSSLEHYLFCLYQMYIQIYSHKTENAANAMLLYMQRLIEKTRMWRPFARKYLYDLDGYCQLDDAAYLEEIKAISEKNAVTNQLFNDLFCRRHLWKRMLEVRPDKDSVSLASIKKILDQNGIMYEPYKCDRDILKGLDLGEEGDALLVLTRELKMGEPRLSNLRDVSDLCMLFAGKKYVVHRYYAPSKFKMKIKKSIEKAFLKHSGNIKQ